jgi:diadenosine tetraphosphate (Ap4A) HIT family hydrolase
VKVPGYRTLGTYSVVGVTECPICSRGRPLGVIGEGTSTWFTAGSPSPIVGYVCVVAKRHVVEPFQLEGEERAAFWEETLTAAEAVDRVFRPRKLNYEIHGNTLPHLHVHIYPRYDGDPFEGRPIDPRERSVEWPTGALERLIDALAKTHHPWDTHGGSLALSPTPT